MKNPNLKIRIVKKRSKFKMSNQNKFKINLMMILKKKCQYFAKNAQIEALILEGIS